VFTARKKVHFTYDGDEFRISQNQKSLKMRFEFYGKIFSVGDDKPSV
jgi:hypothetical protein